MTIAAFCTVVCMSGRIMEKSISVSFLSSNLNSVIDWIKHFFLQVCSVPTFLSHSKTWSCIVYVIKVLYQTVNRWIWQGCAVSQQSHLFLEIPVREEIQRKKKKYYFFFPHYQLLSYYTLLFYKRLWRLCFASNKALKKQVKNILITIVFHLTTLNETLNCSDD